MKDGDWCYLRKHWTFNMHAKIDQMYQQPAATFISEQLTGIYIQYKAEYNSHCILPKSSTFSGLMQNFAVYDAIKLNCIKLYYSECSPQHNYKSNS